MKAIFDTCVLYDDLALTTLNSRMILGQAARGKFDFVMPNVVFLEMVNKMRERIEAATAKMAKGAISLEKIGVGQEIAAPDHAPLTVQFSEDLKARIMAAGSLLSIANVSHDELVPRSILGRKPFRSSGVGYRDALIWQTVVEQAQEDEVVFVSSNTKDFGEDGKLYPDLLDDLAGASHTVTLLGSVEEFIEKHIPPADQALIKVRQLFGNAAFALALKEKISELIGDYDHWPYHSAVTLVPSEPVGMLSEGPMMTSIDTVDLIATSIEDAFEFDPDDETTVLTLVAKAELMLDLLFDKGDAEWLIESEAEVSFYDFDFNESYAAGQTIVYVKSELQAVFSQSNDEIDQLELVSMEDLPEDDDAHPASQTLSTPQ